MSITAPLSRRSCLRGLGVALALPFLETMAWADPPKSAGQKRPVRLAFFYTPYGFGRGGSEPWFWPKDAASFSSRPGRCRRCSRPCARWSASAC